MKNDLPKGWKIETLGEVTKIFVGRDLQEKNFSKIYSEIFTFPIYSNSVENKGLYGYYNFAEFEGESLTVVGRGAGLGMAFSRNNGFGAIGRLLILFPKENTNAKYLTDYINSQINFHIESSGIPQLTGEQISAYKILLPPLPEQQKIAQILSTWDEAIQTTQHLLEKLESRKKGMMQKLLNRRGNEKNAGIVFKTFSEKNHPNEPLLSATQDRGVIPRTMLAGRVASPDGSTSGYKLVQEGDFIISLRSFEGGLEYSEYRGIISPAYTILQPKLPIDRSFYKHFFKSERFIRRLGVAVIGIRDGKQISFEDFSIIKIPFPSLEEQSAIAKILNTADTEIQETKAYLKTLKHQKKGLMQSLLTGKIIVKTNG